VDLPGDTLVSKDWVAPPEDLKGLVLSTKNFFAGYSGNQLFLSEVALPYAWPRKYAIDFLGDIIAIHRYGDHLAVFSTDEIALIVGHSPDTVRKIKVEGFERLQAPRACTEAAGGLFFATDSGIAALSGTTIQLMSSAIFSQTQWRDLVTSSTVFESDGDFLYVLFDRAGRLMRFSLGQSPNIMWLSDSLLDIVYSEHYSGLASLPDPADEGTVFIYDSGSLDTRSPVWRSKVELSNAPMSPISVRILSSQYPVEFNLYSGLESLPALTLNIMDDTVRKLPVVRRSKRWSFEVRPPEGASLDLLEIGTNGRIE
jgi:hypothetical protein